MKIVAAAVLASLAMTCGPTRASDLFGPAAPPLSDPPAVEVGSNWYIRGDLGISLDNVPDVSLLGFGVPPTGVATVPISANFTTNQSTKDFAADVGFGYRFNNFFRMDATYEYRNLPGASASAPAVGCPNSLITLYDIYQINQATTSTSTVNGVATTTTTNTPITVTQPLGYQYDTGTKCIGNVTINQQSNMGMVTGYVDLGSYWGFTPYVGVGAGLNVTSDSGNIVYNYASSGTTYNANLTPTGSTALPTINGGGATPTIWLNKDGSVISPQPNVSFSQQNWNRTISSVKYGMAWAITAGFGYQITPSATLDFSYRYLNTGAPTTVSISGMTMKEQNTAQQFRVGFRYMLN